MLRMKLSSAVLLVVLHLVSLRALVIKLRPHASAHFQRLMVKHQELFKSEEEVQARLQNFIAADKIIDAHNNGPNGRYFQLERNKMSILSTEEKTGMRGKIFLHEDRQLPKTTSTTTTRKPTTTSTTTTKKPSSTTTKQAATTTTKKPSTTTTKKPSSTTTKQAATSTTKKPSTTTTKQPTTTTKKPITTTIKPTTTSTRKPSTSTTVSTTTVSTTKSTSTISISTSSPVGNGFDLRASTLCGKQIPVKEQQCGSCWAYSAIAPIEWAQCNKTGIYTRLSEQELISCDKTNYGCNGGDPYISMTRIKSNQSGVVATEQSYFNASGGSRTCSLNSPRIVTGATLASYTMLPCTVNDGASASVADIENAIMNYGVVSTCVLATIGPFDNYASGVFVDPSCIMRGKCMNTNTDHSGSLVGWGFNSTLNMPYWIFRNQWTKNWGMGGYMNIQKGVNMCGIESGIIYATVV